MNHSFTPDQRLTLRAGCRDSTETLRKVEVKYSSSFFNIDHPLLLSVQIVKIKLRGAALEKSLLRWAESYV